MKKHNSGTETEQTSEETKQQHSDETINSVIDEIAIDAKIKHVINYLNNLVDDPRINVAYKRQVFEQLNIELVDVTDVTAVHPGEGVKKEKQFNTREENVSPTVRTRKNPQTGAEAVFGEITSSSAIRCPRCSKIITVRLLP